MARKGFVVTVRGEEEDAYVKGDVLAALRQAFEDGDLEWAKISVTDGGRFIALGGFSHHDEDVEDYWGNDCTAIKALRWMLGAVLDTREGR